VVLHQPDKRLLLSGDHIIGRVSLYYDFGYTPDPAGEYLSSLDTVEELDVDLVLAGHGKPVRGLSRLVGANRSAVRERIGRVRDAIASEALTPFEIVPQLMGEAELTPMMVNWGLSEALCYLRHLELEGQAEKLQDTDPEQWRRAP